MTIPRSKYVDDLLWSLKNYSLEYTLLTNLKRKYPTPEDISEDEQKSLDQKKEEIQERIDWYAERLSKSPADIALTLDENSLFKEISSKAVIYFKQGLEMFEASLNMPLNSGPLVEYYSLLQCVKGRVLLDLRIVEPKLFSFHGIIVKKSHKSRYIEAEMKKFGVYQSLLLITTPKTELEAFFDAENLFLEDLLNKNRTQYSFIISWMLSSLVRYNPVKWKEICDGKKDNIILKIEKFRKETLPRHLDNLLNGAFPFYIWKIHDKLPASSANLGIQMCEEE